MNKKDLSERDICTKFITPAIKTAGWDVQTQMREEVTFTAGRIIVRGKTVSRGKSKRADFILYHKPNIPLAIIEAKDNKHQIGDGMQQALGYAETLDIPFVFSSNGDGFLFHDKLNKTGKVETQLSLEDFPSPSELWSRYQVAKGLKEEEVLVVNQDYYSDGSGKSPRYYQLNAINRTVEAIAKGQDRVLLVMATGTGKTYTAFQIIWRLWKSRMKKRILFLADRNILVDQTRNNDFSPFGDAMTKITKRQINKAFEIYLCLYQAVTGNEEEKNIYKQFSPDFFDLIVIDECHRGSAAEDSAWREILSYFNSASHVGLTATPKETKDVSNIHYFGEPVYNYSLKQGIEDGFLAPYKVVRIDLDKDLEGWRPEKGKLDAHGNEIEDRIYNQRDFDRNLVLEKRTELVARKVSEFLKGTDRYSKTIVFCEDIDHAERMRSALVNENEDIAKDNRKYIMRITGDNDEGKAELDNFIDPESTYPVITTTSKLMTTGVDAQTCKLVVLDRRIQSMTEFKQIIGRGTRINEDYDKLYFTIMDFRKATELFADPDFDGDPEIIFEPGPDQPPIPPDEDPDNTQDDGDEKTKDYPIDDVIIDEGEVSEPPKKYYVKDVPVNVISERVLYYDNEGKLVTESISDYTKKNMPKDCSTMDSFLKTWSSAERKQAVVEELEEQGILFEALADKVGRDVDPFDMICHVVFDQPPLTRKERANSVKKRDVFSKYGEQARAVLEALLEKYADEGIQNLESFNVLKLDPIRQMGTPIEIVAHFGGKKGYLQAIHDLEEEIYRSAS